MADRAPEDAAIPISYTIDAENGIILSVSRGIVTSADLFAYLRAQLDDPDVPLPLRDLHDMTLVERLEVSADSIRRIVTGAERDPKRLRDARLAVIAPKDHVYGTFRILQSMAEGNPAFEELNRRGLAPEVAVFRQREKALEWLLSGEGPARPDSR